MQNETIVIADYSIKGFEKVMRMALLAIVILAGIALLYFALSIGISRSEIAECDTWSQQAKEFPSQFYLLSWQDQQCRAHGIVINAPIK